MSASVDHRGDLPGRWADIDGLLLRAGAVTGPGFEPGEDVKTVLHDIVHVLVVGAGGLGCELLKDLGASPRDPGLSHLVAGGGDSSSRAVAFLRPSSRGI